MTTSLNALWRWGQLIVIRDLIPYRVLYDMRHDSLSQSIFE